LGATGNGPLPCPAVAPATYRLRIDIKRFKDTCTGKVPTGFRLDSAAVGALGAVAAAIVALLAYAWPRPAPPPPSPPVPASSRQAGPTTPGRAAPGEVQPSTTAPEPDPTTPAPSPTTARPPVAVPSLSLAPLPPAGSEDALAVVARHERTAGSTTLSQQAAASQAYQGMMGASLSAQGAVYTVAVALAQDFKEMEFILSDMLSQDYGTAQARTRADARTLRDVCDSG